MRGRSLALAIALALLLLSFSTLYSKAQRNEARLHVLRSDHEAAVRSLRAAIDATRVSVSRASSEADLTVKSQAREAAVKNQMLDQQRGMIADLATRLAAVEAKVNDTAAIVAAIGPTTTASIESLTESVVRAEMHVAAAQDEWAVRFRSHVEASERPTKPRATTSTAQGGNSTFVANHSSNVSITSTTLPLATAGAATTTSTRNGSAAAVPEVPQSGSVVPAAALGAVPEVTANASSPPSSPPSSAPYRSNPDSVESVRDGGAGAGAMHSL